MDTIQDLGNNPLSSPLLNSPQSLAVFACGNPFRHDDGVGYFVGRVLAKHIPLGLADVHLYEHVVLDLAVQMSSYEYVLVIDAALGGSPGEVVVLDLNQRSCLRIPESLVVDSIPVVPVHTLDPATLSTIAFRIGSRLKQCRLVLVTVEDTSLGIGLSRPVVRAIRKVFTVVLDTIESLRGTYLHMNPRELVTETLREVEAYGRDLRGLP